MHSRLECAARGSRCGNGAQAAVARINLDGKPSLRALDAMQSGNADILDLQLVKLG